jgi:hypothetical protein
MTAPKENPMTGEPYDLVVNGTKCGERWTEQLYGRQMTRGNEVSQMRSHLQRYGALGAWKPPLNRGPRPKLRDPH